MFTFVQNTTHVFGVFIDMYKGRQLIFNALHEKSGHH